MSVVEMLACPSVSRVATTPTFFARSEPAVWRSQCHTIDSTLWIMAECMRREAEASLVADVILVDRPVSDALGYLEGALAVSGRSVDAERLATLKALARAYAAEYDILIETVLDIEVPLGPARDKDPELRLAAARYIAQFADQFRPDRLKLTSQNRSQVCEDVMSSIRGMA